MQTKLVLAVNKLEKFSVKMHQLLSIDVTVKFYLIILSLVKIYNANGEFYQ